MKMEEPSFLTLDSTTKLQSSKEYGTTTKQKYKSMEQVESPEINPSTYGQLIYV